MLNSLSVAVNETEHNFMFISYSNILSGIVSELFSPLLACLGFFLLICRICVCSGYDYLVDSCIFILSVSFEKFVAVQSLSRV